LCFYSVLLKPPNGGWKEGNGKESNGIFFFFSN
jgi:hypothetical protein